MLRPPMFRPSSARVKPARTIPRLAGSARDIGPRRKGRRALHGPLSRRLLAVRGSRALWLPNRIVTGDGRATQARSPIHPPIHKVMLLAGSLISLALGWVMALMVVFPDTLLALPGASQVRLAAAVARNSTVRVNGDACGVPTAGTGFVAAPGLVVTAAHVVAGTNRSSVQDAKGRHEASVVVLDPETDVAVLRTSGLAGRPLLLSNRLVSRGEKGAVLGFPLGRRLRATPATVRDYYERAAARAVQRGGILLRNVYQLKSDVIKGQSGGPFLGFDGKVLGLVHSGSLVKEDVAYALGSKDIASALRRAERHPRTIEEAATLC